MCHWALCPQQLTKDILVVGQDAGSKMLDLQIAWSTVGFNVDKVACDVHGVVIQKTFI